MIIDGKALAAEIIAWVAAKVVTLPTPPHLTVFTCAPNFETQKFLALKQKQASLCGVTLVLRACRPDVTLEEMHTALQEAAIGTDGIIIQFPFPPHVATADLITLIPLTHDVDAFAYKGEQTEVLPPVVGAIAEIAKKYAVKWGHKRVVVVGNGRLVGAPAAHFARSQGGEVIVITKDTDDEDQQQAIAHADILILGAGVPGLITANMVKEGVIIFDAGTTEEGGMLVGDADPLVASKATLLTPVPGGIGPLTIAILLKNVLNLAKKHRKAEQNMV